MNPAMPTLLYIDDDAVLARLVERGLPRLGFKVVHAASGTEGLNRLAQGGIDVIALDQYMPGLDGLETLERILAVAPAMEPVARLVRASHERFDGAGYPDRHAGGDIPLGARIIAVCDAFHAMTNNRPYRSGMGVVDAFSRLRKDAGSQFDPVVVDAFGAVLAAGEACVPASAAEHAMERPA